MLKLKPNPTFKAKVGIPTPEGEAKVEFTFRHKTRAQLQDYLFGEHPDRSDVDAVLEIAEAWSGVDGEFGRESLDELFQNYHGAAKAIVKTYAEQLTQARSGN